MAKTRNIGEPVILENNKVNSSSKKRNIGEHIILQNSVEEQEKILKQSQEVPLSALKIVNGRLTVDNDALAQSKGFINAMDEADYKANNPDLYEASGGVKVIKPGTNVDMSGAPLKSVGTYDHNYATNLSSAAVNKAYENSNSDKVKEVENIVDTIKSGKWFDANTMKKYSETVSSYANGVIMLNELGLLNFNTEEDRKSTIDNLKTLKDDVNKIKNYYAGYKDVDSYNKSVWNSKYSAMTQDELVEEEKRLRTDLLNNKSNSTIAELAFVKNILSTQDKQMWDAMANLKGKNINEINEVADGYKYASEDYKKYNGYIETFKSTHKDAEIKDFESDEEIDAYVKEAREFFVEYRKENGSFDGAREAYQLKKGYLNYDGKPDKEEEKSTFLLDMAEKLARLEVSYGNEKFVKDFYEKEEEYRWNLMSSQEFRKYYAEMQDDPNASSYIAKGKEKYDIKDENISEEEYNVACYHLGKGATKKHDYFVWLKDWVYKREVAAKDGWSALSDGETLKYHTLWSDYTNDAPLEANIMSVALNLGSGIEFAHNALNGEIKESKLSKASSKIREAYANSHDGEFLGIDYDFLYNTVMSGIDSLTAGKLFGKGKVAVEAASILLGLSAAASGVNDALDRGMTGAQALFNGLANGINEYLWEKVSLGQLDELSASNGAGFKTWFKNLLKESFVNATEETATEASNMLYDTVFNGDLSHYSLSVQRYIDNGLTEEKAKNQALKDLGNQIAEAAGSGALMGFGFSFVGNTSASINAARYGKYYYGFSQKSVYALVDNGLAMPEGSEAYKLAIKSDAKLKKGKNLSGTALYNLATAIESEIETKSKTRFSELGIDKKTAKELSPIVAKAVFGEKLSSAERSTLNNSEIAVQVVKELSADRANTVWKDAIKSSRINNVADNNSVTEQGDILQSTADGVVDNVADSTIAQQGGRVNAAEGVGAVQSDSNGVAAPGVVEGADGKQYFDDGSGDEYFGDTSGDDVAHGGDEYDNVAHLTTAEGGASPQGEAIDGENSNDLQLSEPALKDIARAPTAEESIAAAISNEQLDTKQLRISDFVKKHFPEITLKFSGDMTKDGLWDPESKTLLLNTNQTVAGMYIEVLKHEFMHRLEGKRLYQEFKQFLFNKDVTFGVWAKVQCKVHGIELTQNATASEAISKLTEYYHDSVKNDMAIAKKYREAFTMDGAQREMVADFFGEVMFNGKKYRTQTAQALADETFIRIFDESERAGFQASSMAALAEIAEYKPNIFRQIVDWVKRIILKLRGTRIKADAILADELERNIKMLEDYVKQVYNSRDTKKAAKNGGGVEYQAIKRDANGNSYWHIDSEKDIFKNIKNAKKLKEAAYNYILHGDKGNKVNGLIDGQNLEFIRVSANEYVYGKQSQKLEGKTYKQKMRISPSIIDLIENADIKYDAPDHKNHKLFPNGFKNYQGRVGIDDTIFRYIVRVGKAKSGMIFYDINLEVDVEVPSAKSTSLLKKSTSTTNIPNSTKNVKSEISNDKNNDNSNQNPSFAVTSQMQQLRYNPEAYAKYVLRQFGAKNIDNERIAKKIKQIVAQDNKSAKAQEDTRQKVYDRKGNLVGELTLKERLINELAVEISESIEAPLMAEADEVLSGLKERPLRVNEKQEAEIRHQFGTLANFRKDTGIRLVSEKSEVAAGLTTLEDAWNGDWVTDYAGWFKGDVSDVNMPIRLAEIVEQLNGMTEELDTEAIAAEVADSLTKTLNETGPRAEKRRVNEAYRRGVADEHAKNEKQISELRKQNRNFKNRVKPKDVQNIRKEVERIYKKLAANSSTKHVHQGLKKAVSEFLELFNQSDEFTFKPADRDKVTRLWREYQKLAETDATSEAYGYDAQIAINIEMLEEILPGRSIWELHPDELAQVKEIIQNVSHCIENVNNMIIEGKTEEIATVANSVRVELGHKKGKIFDLGKLDLDMKNTTPVYFFERLGSKTLQKLFGGIKKGENVWAKNMLAARDKIAEIRKRYGYNKWKDVTLKFTTKLGDQIELDLEQAMLLYATVKRERANLSQEAEHTYIGGVVIPTKKVRSLMSDIRGFTKHDGESDANAKKRYEGLVESLRKQIDVAPHQIRVSDFAKVSDFLTEQQKAYVDEMVAYLSNDMAKLGNEVSMQLFGIEKFNEKYYIPYNSADNFIASMPGVEPTSSIKHRSFTKDLTHGANNPLMLTSFSEVCANHIEQMCMYNAMAIPVDNLTRVLNYTVPGTETSKATSIKDEIERVLGKSGLRYINNLIRDMSGSVRVSDLDSLVGRFTSRYKKAAVLASLSVVIQQPTSIVRAFKYIPAKYFLKTTFKVAERNYEQMKQYVGEAIIKEMGGFDTGVGATNSDYLLQPKRTAGQFIDDVAGWGANKADQITWGHIWAASKRMVAEQNPGLQVGSDAFFEKAAEICSETLSKTQVYDSVLVKSEAMRSKSELSKMMTAFMSEPTVTYNMMMGALRDVKAHKKGAVKELAGTSAVIIGQIVVNAAFKSLVYAMRDDDEDETYFEKWLASFVESSVSDLNYFNYLPYVKDIVSIMQGYSVERMDVAAIADIKQAIEKAFAENTTDLERLKNLCTALSLLTGVPVKNIWRDAEGAYNTIHNAIKKDIVNTPDGSEKAAKVGFAEALDWLPGIEIDTDGSGRLVSELEGNVTYDSFDDADKQAVEKGVSNYLKNSEKFEKGELRSKSKTFESLYEMRRKYGSTSKKYRKERKKLIDSGIDEKDLELGLEIAKYKYLEQNGITVAEYYAAKTELNRKDGEDKVYDTDGSGGLNKKETKAAIKKMKGFDKDEKDILFNILKP